MGSHSKLTLQLELVVYLSGGIFRTIDEIKSRFEFSERTVYRYLETLREVGFILEHEHGGYKLDMNEGTGKSIGDLLHFSKEEAYILSRAIQSIDDNNILKSNLAA